MCVSHVHTTHSIHAQSHQCIHPSVHSFIHPPPINPSIHPRTRRFELNFETFQHDKVNSRFAFPTEINLEPYTKEGVAVHLRTCIHTYHQDDCSKDFTSIHTPTTLSPTLRTYVRAWVYVHVCMYMYVCIPVYMCVWMYGCVYVWYVYL